MPELSQLNIDFARQFPALYARELGSADVKAVSELLQALPGNVSVTVAAHLPAELLSLLANSGKLQMGVGLEEATLDEATAMLNRLPREHCLMLVDRVKNATKRRRLLRFLNYPPHSVGSVANHAELRFNHDDSLSLVVEALRGRSMDKEPAIMIVANDGRYAGVLDVWRLVSADVGAAVVADCMSVVRPLRAESTQVRAIRQPAWRDRSWLPVVDHQDRILGLCWRTILEDSTAESASVKSDPIDNLASLGVGYVRVMGALLNVLFGGRRA